MRAKWFLAIIGVMMLAGVASASVVDCVTALGGAQNVTNLLAIAGVGDSGCQIGDVLIQNVTVTGLAGNTAIGEVDLPPTNSNGAERGLIFDVNLGAGSTFSITFSGSLCYTTAACIVNAGQNDFLASASTLITEGQVEQQVPGNVGDNATTINSITPLGSSALNLNAGPGNSANPQVVFPGVTSFTVSLGNNGAVAGSLNSIEGDVEETVGPEPSTMLLMGGALAGLAALARKRRKA